MLYFLPNLLTLINLFSGCLALVFVFRHRPTAVLACMGLSLLADFLDGLLARRLGVIAPIGKQLDSLADVVSFGVVPGAILYMLIQGVFPVGGNPGQYLPFTGFIFTIIGAYRLARFNVDSGATDHFVGLPIPAAALYVVGLYWIAEGTSCLSCTTIFINPYVLGLSIVLLCYLMTSTLPHFSFKVKSTAWRGQKVQWIYLVLLLPLALLFKEASLSLAIVLYVFLSLIKV